MTVKTFSFMYRPEYKKVFEELSNGMKRVKVLHRYDSKEQRTQQTIDDIKQNAFKVLQNFVKSEKNRIRIEMDKIEKSYKITKNTYADPQSELLRRQDFDLEIANADRTKIIEMLKDADRNYSVYELNKIMATAQSNDIKAIAKRRLDEVKEPYIKDPVYQQLNLELSHLSLLNKPSEKLLLWYPSEDSPNGYRTVGLNSLNTATNSKKVAIEFEELFSGISQSLDTLYKSQPTVKYSDQLDNYKAKEIKKREDALNYTNYDSRAIRGSKNFDIVDRFKYLKERYGNEDNRFDPLRDDYDVNIHYQWLEAQHDKRMKTDSSFAENYKNAAKQLKKIADEEIEEINVDEINEDETAVNDSNHDVNETKE